MACSVFEFRIPALHASRSSLAGVFESAALRARACFLLMLRAFARFPPPSCMLCPHPLDQPTSHNQTQVAPDAKFVDLGADSLDTVRAAFHAWLQKMTSEREGLLPPPLFCALRLRHLSVNTTHHNNNINHPELTTRQPIYTPHHRRPQKQVEIMMALEEKFDIQLDEEGAEKISTVQEAADLIAAQVASK
jgi:acyl carrier protein